MVAIVYGTEFTPWSFTTCSAYEAYDSWPPPLRSSTEFQDQCRRGITVQALAIINFILLASNSLIIIPLIAMPSPIRAQIFFISRAITSRRHKTKSQRQFWSDMEKTPLRGEKDEDDAAGLHVIFHQDRIARILSSHLHVDDVVNVAKTSKAMHLAVFMNTPQGRAERIDLISENACTPGKKTECWACSKVICDASISSPLITLRMIASSLGLTLPHRGQMIICTVASPFAQNATSDDLLLSRPHSRRRGTLAICRLSM
ncbi:hypothetical protein QQS21_001227 [Conoideocrella luteorostrata]|uniref:Uncharacterized protein n=1 Tax=Conoideocrella luteorostrata TaxID=1105319 RepID=A0AAJ0CXJ9_9HYPO|nr:hypothetical protein QQS21_001227 [Conoideocrella luteorostrata]